MAADKPHLEHSAHAIGASGTSTPSYVTHRRYTLRHAVANDAQAIAELGAQLFSSTFGFSMPAEDMQHYLGEAYAPAAIEGELASPQHTFLVAAATDAVPASTPPIQPGSIVGFAQLTTGTTMQCLQGLTENKIELQRLYVHEQFHGTGVARALVEAAEKIARGEHGGHKYAMIWLGVWEENAKAQRFYSKLGYGTKVGSKDFRMGSVVQTDEVFVKHLEY